MRKIRIISFAGVWTLWTAICHGQMSVFPSPPPLAPPIDHSSDEATKIPSSGAAAPDTTDSAQTAAKNSDATPTPSVAPVTAATLSSMAALDDKVPLEPGDSVSFRVIEDRDKAIPLVVTDTGEVDFPYIGRVKVEQKTCHQVAIEVKKLLEVDYYKRATVIVGLDLIYSQDRTKAKDMAWVVGEVRQVGPQELFKAQPMTVSQIVLRAGGFGDFADERKVKVIHRSITASDKTESQPPDIGNIKDFQIIDVKSVFDGKSTIDPVVKAGDYIIVPKKWVNLGT